MPAIIRVEDRFRVNGNQIVVSGVNPDWDELTSEDISSIIGERVLVRQPDGNQVEAEVTGVDAPSSLTGKKNIHIRLAINDDVDVGAVISSVAPPSNADSS
jgi:hypothetical protein